MEILLKIPKEFENHFRTDRFKDSLERVLLDLEHCNRHDAEYDSISGLYEIETIEMLKESLLDSILLPQHHGNLVDVSKISKSIYAEENNLTGLGMSRDERHAYNAGIDEMYSKLKLAPAIIKEIAYK